MRIPLLAALALAAGTAAAAAAPVTFDVQVAGSFGAGSGTFTIDSALIAPAAAVAFSDILVDLDYTSVAGGTAHFSAALGPATDAAIFDPLGEEIAALASSAGPLVGFLSDDGLTTLGITTGAAPFFLALSSAAADIVADDGSVVITRVPSDVPLPAAAPALLAGLAALGFAGRRRAG
ncbi:hypothetical protein ACQ5SO_03190 [Rhodovulum sp. DZ06]|uniref:hypothetical protein n=1 Tax=Rhodovulum sp. DZ06 TaxID=3425126 RepID=UPI003D342012